MGKNKFELAKIVDECLDRGGSNVFLLCDLCAQKLEHTGKYNVVRQYPWIKNSRMDCCLCDGSDFGFDYLITSRPPTDAYTIRIRKK